MKRTFFDIHIHAMDLSHPNLLAFIQRIHGLGLKLVLGGLAEPFLGEQETRVKNLLTVMENSIEDYFILMEYFLKSKDPVPDRDGIVRMGGVEFDTIVITPLVMDFGFKSIKTDTFYNMALGKPVVGQTVDILSAVKKYCNCEFAPKGDPQKHEGTTVPRLSTPIFEIYPFLGINPLLYDYAQLKELLDRCFSGYTGKRVDLHANMGTFGGDIAAVGSNVFAGVKLYPPLGFDPWPLDDRDEGMKKVRYLYSLCQEKGVPITAHCSDGGFATVDNAEELTHPEKWASVLDEFPNLKLNLAHLGHQGNFLGIIHRHEWRNRVISLALTYPNVYTDISCLAFDEGFYEDLAEIIRKNQGMERKILFGSDYMINLQWIGSYNEYLRGFLTTDRLSGPTKEGLCSGNPERFLFARED